MTEKDTFVIHIAEVIKKALFSKLPDNDNQIRMIVKSQTIINDTLTHILAGYSDEK